MVKYDYVKTLREDVRPIEAKQVPAVRFFMRWATKLNVVVFRLTKGRVMNKFIGGYPVCIVTTKGAKTGKVRQIALIHLPHGENNLLVASQGGMPSNPVWYYNIVAYPDIQIMVGGDEKAYRARRISDEEKASLWPHLLSLYPDFDQYQARTDRNIPVFSCEPVA
ncbi:MAG: deazaflavin-dependent oxidoreductase (nitroreductase family) [Halioglobus sp.]|jgi:deazaflavin-dependent oxidoreductase (nitroreductase family)